MASQILWWCVGLSQSLHVYQVQVERQHQVQLSSLIIKYRQGGEVTFFKSKEETIGSAVSSELLEIAEALLGRGSLNPPASLDRLRGGPGTLAVRTSAAPYFGTSAALYFGH